MMMVMTVMAVALHLNQTLRANTAWCQIRCQIFLLRAGREEAENGPMRRGRPRTVGAMAMLCVCLAGLGQNSDRDRSGTAKTSASAPAPEQRVDINHASMDDLLKVPGLTRGWAVRIVRFRPYRTKQDLFEKGVVSSEVYDRIKDFVIAHHEKQ
jgi:DNA uptake protein ComE-like DNA-binding protein